MSFTITNTSQDTAIYQGVSIEPGRQYTPSDATYSDFAADNLLLSDLLVGLATITIGSNDFSGKDAVSLLKGMVNRSGFSSIQFKNKYINISSNRTTVVKSGPGILHSIVINNNSSGLITIYDNTTGSGTVMFCFILVAGAPFSTGALGLEFNTGLTIVTSGLLFNNNVTLLYT